MDALSERVKWNLMGKRIWSELSACKDKIQYLLKEIKMIQTQTPYCGAAETNPTSIPEDDGSIPGLAQRVKDLVLLWAVV